MRHSQNCSLEAGVTLSLLYFWTTLIFCTNIQRMDTRNSYALAPVATIIDRLRKHDITPTRQRLEIGRLLFARAQHVSANQLLARLNAMQSSISKATVYNTLGLFAQKGLLREIVIDPTRRFYDTTITAHHHLYHADTGELEDIPLDKFDIAMPFELPPGIQLDGIDVIIRVTRLMTS